MSVWQAVDTLPAFFRSDLGSVCGVDWGLGPSRELVVYFSELLRHRRCKKSQFLVRSPFTGNMADRDGEGKPLLNNYSYCIYGKYDCLRI
jgi:hypothetical protein